MPTVEDESDPIYTKIKDKTGVYVERYDAMMVQCRTMVVSSEQE